MVTENLTGEVVGHFRNPAVFLVHRNGLAAARHRAVRLSPGNHVFVDT